MAEAPKSDAERDERDLLRSPIGVRDPDTITISVIILLRKLMLNQALP